MTSPEHGIERGLPPTDLNHLFFPRKDPKWLEPSEEERLFPLNEQQSKVFEANSINPLPVLAAHVASIRRPNEVRVLAFIQDQEIPLQNPSDIYYATQYMSTVFMVRSAQELIVEGAVPAGVSRPEDEIHFIKGRFFAIERTLEKEGLLAGVHRTIKGEVDIPRGVHLSRQRMMQVRTIVEKACQTRAKEIRAYRENEQRFPLNEETSAVTVLSEGDQENLVQALANPRSTSKWTLAAFGVPPDATPDDAYYALRYVQTIASIKTLMDSRSASDQGAKKDRRSSQVYIDTIKFQFFKTEMQMAEHLTRDDMMKIRSVVEQAYRLLAAFQESTLQTSHPEETSSDIKRFEELMGQVRPTLGRMRSDAARPAYNKREYPNKFTERIFSPLRKDITQLAKELGEAGPQEEFYTNIAGAIVDMRGLDLLRLFKKLNRGKNIPDDINQFTQGLQKAKEGVIRRLGITSENVELLRALRDASTSSEPAVHSASALIYLYMQILDIFHTAYNGRFVSPGSTLESDSNLRSELAHYLGALVYNTLKVYVHPDAIASIYQVSHEIAEKAAQQNLRPSPDN